MRQFPAFVAAMLGFDTVGLLAYSLLGPPDPFTQLAVLLPTLVLAPVLAYWLVYRGGAEQFGVEFDE